MANLFSEDEYGEMTTAKENIVDYVELTHYVQINDNENREIMQCYGLDKNGAWPNGYYSPYSNVFLSRWQLDDSGINEASEGQLLEHTLKNN